IVEGRRRKRKRFPGRARIPRPKKSGHATRRQIDDPRGDRTARASGNLYDGLSFILDRLPAIVGIERLGPGRAIVIAYVNRGRLKGRGGVIGSGYGRVQSIWVVGIAYKRTDWSIREASACRTGYRCEAGTPVGAAI